MNVFVAALAVIVMGGSVFLKTEGVDYIVGDSTGWRVPPSTNFYSTWASGKNFSVGDVLVFNFTTGVHDVAAVTEDAYDNCNDANTVKIGVGPARIPILNATDYYFICTVSDHCAGGQKLEIDVSGSTTTTPTSPPPPPPPPSSYASSVIATLLITVLSIATTSTILF